MIVELKDLRVQVGPGGVVVTGQVGSITYQETATPEDVTNSRIEPGATLRVLVEDEYAVYVPVPAR